MTVLAWTAFFACVAIAFYLLATDDPDAYDRARDDSRLYDEESWWERDKHKDWNPQEPVSDAEPWGARR